MEIPIIPKNTLQKAEDPSRVRKTDNRKPAAANKLTAAGGDVVTISPKSRLLQSLRTEYGKLEEEQKVKVEALKANVELVHMSTEEIVDGILRGTLFDQI